MNSLSPILKIRAFLLYDVVGRIKNGIDRLKGYPEMKARFKERTGYNLDLNEPLSFNQKICWKKLNDRNPLLPIVSDKLAVREYLIDVLGPKSARDVTIPLLFVTQNPDELPLSSFTKGCVIKANHASGANIIIMPGETLDESRIRETCREWLLKPYGLRKREWAYQGIRRTIVVEELLKGEGLLPPKDYKFHVFHGSCRMIQVNEGHFKDKENRTLTLFTKDWEKIDVFWEFPSSEWVQRPGNLDEMIALAEELAEPFDYVRIDLYSIEGRIFFGEFTNYPTSGMARIDPISFDFEIGSHWKLTPGYWKKRSR